MKKSQFLVAGAVALSGLGFALPAAAGVSGNIAIASQYVFRGLTFGDPQVSGGLDYSADSGLYAGMWVSSAGGEQENDLYVGWANDTFDLGYILYNFPDNATTTDTQEVYAGLSLGGLSATAWYGFNGVNGVEDDEYLYVELNFSLPISDKASLDFHVGHNEITGKISEAPGFGDSNGLDYSVTLSLGDLYVSAIATDYDTQGTISTVQTRDADTPTVVVGYSWSFDDVL